MGSFKLGKMTVGSMFKKPETIQYPVQTRFVPEGLKGHIEVDMNECTLCGICMKRCTTSAITVDKEAASWSINRFRCIQCNYCVLECPTNCLRMEPTYAPTATTKSNDTFIKEVDEEAKAAKEAAKAERVKAALEAKAAREAQKA
ncbi:MAG: 4Fe-4S binding protein [Eggerthellaceae bacterium]|nr:4Fe-4S binding protein [Eggerthellaceae bacterium]